LTDFEKYLLEGRKAGYKDLNVVEDRIAELYLESYKAVSVDLKDFMAKGFTEEEVRKYGRLAQLQKGIADEYRKLTGQVIPIAETSSADSYLEAFKHFEYALDTAEGLSVGWGMPAVDAIRASVYSEQSGFDLIKTFRKNADIRVSQLQGAITRGIIQGQGYVKTAREVKDLFGKGLSDAVRVVRTEEGRNWTEGQLASHARAVDMGIKIDKVWVAAMDRRTRPDHGRLDGQKADKDGWFYAGGGRAQGPGLFGIAKQDINCRCATISQVQEIPPAVRRIKGEGVVEYITYSDWATAQGWTPEKGWPKVEKV
jgi:SPP1 gp7 family putative phage head morphogenesis protein